MVRITELPHKWRKEVTYWSNKQNPMRPSRTALSLHFYPLFIIVTNWMGFLLGSFSRMYKRCKTSFSHFSFHFPVSKFKILCGYTVSHLTLNALSVTLKGSLVILMTLYHPFYRAKAKSDTKISLCLSLTDV